MKIGILSMQRVCNYGSLLQAYALKRTIEDMGHDCRFLDIKKGIELKCHTYAKNRKPKKSLKWLKEKIERQGFKALTAYAHVRAYDKRFRSSFFSLLDLTDELVTNGHFDVVVIGSDEVFNFAQKTWWGFSRQLFGEEVNSEKVVTYAASFGWTTMKDVFENNLEKVLQSAFNKMSCISVRDQNSKSIINQLVSRDVKLCLDPTLIYDFDEETDKKEALGKYIVLYSYTGRTDTPEEVAAIRDFAKKRNKKIVSLGWYHSWCDKNLIPTPFELLEYFKYADYIVTDTFHGTVFSIKYGKPFFSIVRNTNTEKISYLLKQFHLGDRIVSSIHDIPRLFEKEIDLNKSRILLKRKKKESLSYLKTALAGGSGEGSP
jgi:polysaccharide pyruvyl transferase WcaK-like protein